MVKVYKVWMNNLAVFFFLFRKTNHERYEARIEVVEIW